MVTVENSCFLQDPHGPFQHHFAKRLAARGASAHEIFFNAGDSFFWRDRATRAKAVTCYGRPFYSGWGLTDDRASKITRRRARPVLDALLHACLIEYLRYWGPVSGDPCPIDVAP